MAEHFTIKSLELWIGHLEMLHAGQHVLEGVRLQCSRLLMVKCSAHWIDEESIRNSGLGYFIVA